MNSANPGPSSVSAHEGVDARSSARLTLNRVSTREGARATVRDLTLDIEPGECVALVGPRGGGHQNVLRMIAGLDAIDAGTIAVDDSAVHALKPNERGVAMVFERPALFPHMKVFGNLAYGLRSPRRSKNEVVRRVREVAELLAVAHLLDAKPRHLTPDQAWRVAFGRALAPRPAVVLFDDPLAPLDATTRWNARLDLQRVQRRLGITSLYATHDGIEAMALGRRIVVMNAGRVEQIGAPADVYERPATAFVARSFGVPPMNLFNATFAANGEWLTFSGRVDVKLDRARSNLAGAPVFIGVRPEHWSVGPRDEHALPVDVDAVERLGTESLVYGDVDGQRVVLRMPAASAPRAGERLWTRPMPGTAHYFNASTGQRL